MPDDSKRQNRRRQVLKTFGTMATVGIAGCSGGGGDGGGDDGSGDGGGGTTSDGISTPWTTEELAKKAKAEENGTAVIYAGTGDFAPWEQLGEIISERYSFFSIDGFAGKGGDVSQRALQEHQAGEAKFDVLSQADEINADADLRDKFYVDNHNTSYWFSEGETADYTTDWYASPLNGGPSVGMGVNPEKLSEMGLEKPDSWNTLLESEWEDIPVIFAQEPNLKRFGWIVSVPAEEKGMEPVEWFQAQVDNLDLKISSGHTPGARFLGQGQAPLMHHNYPWVVRRFTEKLPVSVHYPSPVPMFTSSGIVSEYANASNPWTARFFISALMEEWMQKEIAQNVDQFGPGRLDIDYSGLGLDDYTLRTLQTDVDLVSFQDQKKYEEIAPKVYKEVLGSPSADLEGE